EGERGDGGVGEGANQMAVHTRRGAGRLSLEEKQGMYIRDGQVYTVTNDVPPRPRKPRAAAEVGSVGAKLQELASSLWMRLTLGLLGLGGAVIMFQRKKPSEKNQK